MKNLSFFNSVHPGYTVTTILEGGSGREGKVNSARLGPNEPAHFLQDEVGKSWGGSLHLSFNTFQTKSHLSLIIFAMRLNMHCILCRCLWLLRRISSSWSSSNLNWLETLSRSQNRLPKICFLAARAAPYLPLVIIGRWHCRIWTQIVTFETSDPADIWSEWCQDKKTKKKKQKETKTTKRP